MVQKGREWYQILKMVSIPKETKNKRRGNVIKWSNARGNMNRSESRFAAEQVSILIGSNRSQQCGLNESSCIRIHFLEWNLAAACIMAFDLHIGFVTMSGDWVLCVSPSLAAAPLKHLLTSSA